MANFKKCMIHGCSNGTSCYIRKKKWRIPYPHPGSWAVLDLQEFQNSVNDHELQFFMVDGDFKKFEGKWSVKSGKMSSKTTLSYELNVTPTFNFRSIFLESIISSDFPVNLQALASKAESSFKNSQNSLTDEAPPVITLANSFISTSSDVSGVTPDKSDFSTEELKEKLVKATLNPLSPATSELKSNWGVFGKVCKLDKPCMVDEVHLHRFDGLLENGGVHCCVIASITVKAPVREVWNILTEYGRFPESSEYSAWSRYFYKYESRRIWFRLYVPNLAISKIQSRENNKVRNLQVQTAGLLYVVLQVRVVLYLCEALEQESSFQQVEGDFDSFSRAIKESSYTVEIQCNQAHGRIQLMNLSLAYKHRKPKGYWDNLENLQEEISWFQKSWGMDPLFMPSRKLLSKQVAMILRMHWRSGEVFMKFHVFFHLRYGILTDKKA
ncbi:unnamed protein product [Coffea canephora]|uniref:Coenzyme Q-binding protein COQ10 START domain-containing protein n=1 Tax=Coffea canephora TaxID=49390 RepID=A0A068UHE6_COFCA|nr:unnamed protein product [Coffea canephora]